MKLFLNSITIIIVICSFAGAKDDILNFKNNDTLHGSFLGFPDTENLLWQSNESSDNIRFNTSEIRKIIFRKGMPARPFSHNSFLTLTNGDIIPCSIRRFANDSITIVTDYIGELKINKKHISHIEFNPLGQKVTYKGPLTAEKWKIVSTHEQYGQDLSPENEDSKAISPWQFGNFSWYNNGTKGAILLQDYQHPESFCMQFEFEGLNSYNTTNVSLIFNADYKLLDNKDNEKRTNSNTQVTSVFGSCFALSIGSSSASLRMYYKTNEGIAANKYIQPTNRITFNGDLSSMNSRIYELRADFTKKVIALYRGKQLMAQWSLREIEWIPNGRGMGFNSLGLRSYRNVRSRISNISVASWNGIMNSRLMFGSKNQDIVNLSNALDRFSGKVTSIDEKKLQLAGNYANMSIPIENIQSVSFASIQTNLLPSITKNVPIFHLGHKGMITAVPAGTSDSSIILNHPILSELKINFKYLSAISYNSTSSLIDQWNTQLR